MLLHVPHILSKSDVAALRAQLDVADWKDGRITAGHQSGQVLGKNGVRRAALRHGRVLLGRHPVEQVQLRGEVKRFYLIADELIDRGVAGCRAL